MKTYIALLRGINVSGKNKIIMADFRLLLKKVRLLNIQTYIQSGNIIFESQGMDKNKLQSLIQATIKKEYDYDVACMILEQSDLEIIIKNNPFIGSENDIRFLHVSIPTSEIDASKLESSNMDFKDDSYKLISNYMYIHTPGGYGKTKLNTNYFERKLKQPITTRNWKTILKLHSMIVN